MLGVQKAESVSLLDERRDFAFSKAQRLLQRREFRRFHSKTYVGRGKFLSLSLRSTSRPQTRIGITVTKRYGRAWARNRFRRLVREAFRLCYHEFPSGIELHVRPVGGHQQMKMEWIREELLRLVAYARPSARI